MNVLELTLRRKVACKPCADWLKVSNTVESLEKIMWSLMSDFDYSIWLRTDSNHIVILGFIKVITEARW